MKKLVLVTVSPKPYGRDWQAGDLGKSLSLSTKAVKLEDKEDKEKFPLAL